jgi:hypothetical protein
MRLPDLSARAARLTLAFSVALSFLLLSTASIAVAAPPPDSPTDIKLDPLTATNPVGTSHTVIATVTTSSGSPQAGVTVTFNINSGPNAGKTGFALTNASGQASFTYTDGGGVGTDTLIAVFTDSAGTIHTSNDATKVWTPSTGDTTAPNCTLSAVDAGPPKKLQVTFQDPDGGLASISPVATTNATVAVPPFSVGTISPVVVDVSKIDQTMSFAVSLTAKDMAGNVVTCGFDDLPGGSGGSGGSGGDISATPELDSLLLFGGGLSGLGAYALTRLRARRRP